MRERPRTFREATERAPSKRAPSGPRKPVVGKTVAQRRAAGEERSFPTREGQVVRRHRQQTRRQARTTPRAAGIRREFPEETQAPSPPSSKATSTVTRQALEQMPLGWKGHALFDQPALDDLFNTIRSADLTADERAMAEQYLLSALKGKKVLNKPAQKAIIKAFGADGEYVVGRIKANTPRWRHAWHAGVEMYHLPRSLMTTGDLSAAGRQAIMALPAHPIHFARNFRRMHRAFGSQTYYDDTMESIVTDPYYGRAKRGDLALDNLGADRPEQLRSTWADRIPVVTGGGLARGSQRAYTMFLSKLRMDIWVNEVKKAESLGLYERKMKTAYRDALKQGASEERAQEAARRASDLLDAQFASTVNNATGRGGLGPLDHPAVASFLSSGLFAPRLLVSRLNFINPAFYLDPRIPWRVRQQRLKMGALLATSMGGTLYMLDKIPGVDANFDPTSTDFGKVKIGDIRVDLAGGYAAPITLILRMMQGAYTTVGGDEKNVAGLWRGKGDFGGETGLTLLEKFGRQKLAPIPAEMANFFAGSDVNKRDITWWREGLESMVPLMGSDMYDLIDKEGWDALWYGLPSIYGVSSRTYKDDEQPTGGGGGGAGGLGGGSGLGGGGLSGGSGL